MNPGSSYPKPGPFPPHSVENEQGGSNASLPQDLCTSCSRRLRHPSSRLSVQLTLFHPLGLSCHLALPAPSPFKPHFPAWASWAAADRRPAVGWVTPHAGRVQWPSTADSLALLPAIQVWGAHGRQPGLSAPASRKDPSQLHKPGQPAAGLGDRPRGSSEPWPPAGPAQGWEWVRPKVALRGVEREGARNNHLTAL